MRGLLYDLRAPVRARMLAFVHESYSKQAIHRLLTIFQCNVYAFERSIIPHHILRKMRYRSTRADSHIVWSVNC